MIFICVFSIPSPRLGDRKHTTRWIKILSNPKLWEILYLHEMIFFHTFYLCCRYLQEYTALGTAGGLYHFRDQILAGNPDSFFVMNSDVCGDFPLKEMLSFTVQKGGGSHCTVLGTEVRGIWSFEGREGVDLQDCQKKVKLGLIILLITFFVEKKQWGSGVIDLQNKSFNTVCVVMKIIQSMP